LELAISGQDGEAGGVLGEEIFPLSARSSEAAFLRNLSEESA